MPLQHQDIKTPDRAALSGVDVTIAGMICTLIDGLIHMALLHRCDPLTLIVK